MDGGMLVTALVLSLFCGCAPAERTVSVNAADISVGEEVSVPAAAEVTGPASVIPEQIQADADAETETETEEYTVTKESALPPPAASAAPIPP